MLVTLSFFADQKHRKDVVEALLHGKLSVNKGMYFENEVAQELVSKGHGLYFASFNEGRNLYEVDFLLRDGRRCNLSK